MHAAAPEHHTVELDRDRALAEPIAHAGDVLHAVPVERVIFVAQLDEERARLQRAAVLIQLQPAVSEREQRGRRGLARRSFAAEQLFESSSSLAPPARVVERDRPIAPRDAVIGILQQALSVLGCRYPPSLLEQGLEGFIAHRPSPMRTE